MTPEAEIINKLNSILRKMDVFEQAMGKPQTPRMLTRQEMCENMKISIRTFDNLAPDMVPHGLVKVGGQWRMSEKKFEHFKNSLEV